MTLYNVDRLFSDANGKPERMRVGDADAIAKRDAARIQTQAILKKLAPGTKVHLNEVWQRNHMPPFLGTVPVTTQTPLLVVDAKPLGNGAEVTVRATCEPDNARHTIHSSFLSPLEPST